MWLQTVVRNTITLEVYENGPNAGKKESAALYTTTDNGHTVWQPAKQGTDFPGAEVKQGEYSLDLNFKKGCGAAYRLMFFVDMANNATNTFTGGVGQSEVFIHYNMTNGGFQFGAKINNQGGNPSVMYTLSLAAIKDCAYTRKFNSATTGAELTVGFRLVFAIGKVKVYVDNCLIFVYGYEAEEYADETLYGVHCTYENGATAGRDNFITAIESPTAFGIGVWAWTTMTSDVIASNIRYIDTIPATKAVSEPSAQSVTQDQLLTYLDSKERQA